MEIHEKDEMNRKYTIYTGETILVESYSVQLVLHHMLEGILPARVYTLDQQQGWSCEHTGKVSLKKYCEEHELKKEDVQWILGGLLKNLQEVQEYLLDADAVYMDVSKVFLDLSEKKVWNCYVPFYKVSVWSSLQNLIRFLLGHLERQETDTVCLLYGIYRYLDQGGTQVEKIWKLLYEKGVQKKAESRVMIQSVPEEHKIAEQYSYKKWVLVAVPIALAVFIISFVMLNEWYLSDQKKVLLLVAAGIFLGISVVLHSIWRPTLKQANPLDRTGVQQTNPLQRTEVQQAWLVRTDAKEKFLVPTETTIIGKSREKTQICLSEPVISRIHAKISMRDGEYYIEDMDSKNGTYVNRKRLKPEKPVRLQDGDVLVFANAAYDFQLSNK